MHDEEEHGHKCETLMLSTNNYNGWLPKSNECLVAKKLPKFSTIYDSALLKDTKNTLTIK